MYKEVWSDSLGDVQQRKCEVRNGEGPHAVTVVKDDHIFTNHFQILFLYLHEPALYHVPSHKRLYAYGVPQLASVCKFDRYGVRVYADLHNTCQQYATYCLSQAQRKPLSTNDIAYCNISIMFKCVS